MPLLNNLARSLQSQVRALELSAIRVYTCHVVALNNWAGLSESHVRRFQGVSFGRSMLRICSVLLSGRHFDRPPNPPLVAQGKYTEVERLYERSQFIREKVLRPDHPAVGTVLNDRAVLLEIQVKFHRKITWRSFALQAFGVVERLAF